MFRSDTNTYLIIGTLLLASALTIMVDNAITSALPAIRSHFASVENAELLVRLVLVLPSLFVALGAPIMGVLIDRFGRKPILGVSTGLYGIAGSAGYILDTLPTLLASRALLGIGTAGVFVTATTLISDYFPNEDQRNTVFGWQGAFTTFGGTVFLVVGGVLASIGWRFSFLIYVGAFALMPLIVFVLYEPERAVDDSSTFTRNGSMRQLVKQVPLGQLALIYACALVGMIVFFMVPVEVPFYLTEGVNAGSIIIGVAIGVSTLFSAILSTQYTRIRTRLGIVPIVALMFSLLGVGFGIISLGHTVWTVMLGLAVAGAGVGLLAPNLNAWVANDIPEDMRGRAFGGLTGAIFLGQFLSPLISSPISARLGLRLTFRVGGIVLIGLSIVFLALSSRGRVGNQLTEGGEQDDEGIDSSVSKDVD